MNPALRLGNSQRLRVSDTRTYNPTSYLLFSVRVNKIAYVIRRKCSAPNNVVVRRRRIGASTPLRRS